MNASTITISSLADEAYALFQRRERDNGESFTSLKDTAPEWLHDLVREAHGEFLPDDWRYDAIRSALGDIGDSGAETADDLDDVAHEFADGNVDTYNAARIAWLASHLSRAGYCDDAAQEFGFEVTQERGIFDLIGLGQYRESEEIFQSVRESLEARLEEMQDADEES
jgi:hypothetical protein